MARPRRETVMEPGATVDHPWERPGDVAAARQTYLTARARAGGPPLALAGETYPAQRQRLHDAPAQSLWNAARFDPDPEVRTSALVDAVRCIRDRLACDLDQARFGLRREDSTLRAAEETRWSTHRISRFGGPFGYVRRMLILGGADGHPVPDAVGPAEQLLAELIADAATVGLRVAAEYGAPVEAQRPRRLARERKHR